MAEATVTVSITDLPQVKALMTAARTRIQALETALRDLVEHVGEQCDPWTGTCTCPIGRARDALTARTSVPPSSRAVTEGGE